MTAHGERGARAGSGFGLVVVGAVWLVPYAWMVLTSLKTLPEIVETPAYPLPRGVDLGAYHEVLTTMPVARYLANTLVMAR